MKHRDFVENYPKSKMEGENLVTKVDAVSKRFDELFVDFKEIVKDERTKMKAEVAAYNLEKERMKAVMVNDNDIIHLNVGGQKMSTKRSTLCQVEGSLLASMFSGRWEDGLERDKDGCIFFDFNPQYFSLILDYLRAKKIETPENRALLPKIPSEQLKNFNILVGYLDLKEELTSTITETFKSHSAGITIEENGAVAVHGSAGRHQYVLGENIYEVGGIHWQLKLESFLNNNWMFVGIVKGDTVPSKVTSYGWSGSYGWALGNRGQVYNNGQCSNNDSLTNTCKQGDTVELTLNCATSTLTLVVPSGLQFIHTLPSSATWRLHVNLHGSNDKIRIV